MLANILIIVIVVALFILCLKKVITGMKKGECDGCGGNCSGCGTPCHTVTKKNDQQ